MHRLVEMSLLPEILHVLPAVLKVYQPEEVYKPEDAAAFPGDGSMKLRQSWIVIARICNVNALNNH